MPFSKPYHCFYPQRTGYWNQITNNSIDALYGVSPLRIGSDLKCSNVIIR